MENEISFSAIDKEYPEDYLISEIVGGEDNASNRVSHIARFNQKHIHKNSCTGSAACGMITEFT